MKRLMILFFFIAIISQNAQQWQGFYNRIPAWPKEINLKTIENYENLLLKLREDIQNSMPNYMDNMENLSEAEAMKIAQNYQKNAANMSVSDIERMSNLTQNAVDVELPKEMEIDGKLAAMKQEFDDRIYNDMQKLKAQYPCDPGLGETGCDVQANELIKLSDKLASEYFLSSTAKFRSAVDTANDYMIKEKLPLQVQREKDQFNLMGMNVSGDYSALQLVDACLAQLLEAADKMMWLARLKEDGNVFYSPGQAY